MAPSQKLEGVLFGILLLLCGVIALCAGLEQPPNVVGGPHPTFETMRQGGSADRHDGLMLIGWLFGTLQIGFFVSLLVLAVRTPRGSRGALRPLLLVGTLYGAVWSVQLLAYFGAEGRWLAFPPASAVMLMGLWPVPLLFCVLYMRGFGRFIYTEGDRSRFEAIMARRRDSEAAHRTER